MTVRNASRLVQRASQYGMDDALGYLWQMERTRRKCSPS